MYRGTTPSLIFNLPIDPTTLTQAWITISQNNNVVINKTLAECQIQDTSIICSLSQQDTLLLQKRIDAQVQLRVLTEGGDALASPIYSVKVQDILKDGVIE